MTTTIFRYTLFCGLIGVFACLFYGLLLTERQPKFHLTFHEHIAIVDYDENHVPRISGSSDNAVYYALGYTHAMDRLWQMHLLRRLASGRISEVIPAFKSGE